MNNEEPKYKLCDEFWLLKYNKVQRLLVQGITQRVGSKTVYLAQASGGGEYFDHLSECDMYKTKQEVLDSL